MPQQRIRAYCPLCISHCGCIATVSDGRLLKLEGDPGHPTGTSFCIKGMSAPEQVGGPDRLLYPLKRTAAKGAADPLWRRISWDEALDAVARNLERLASGSGAESVAFSVTTPSGTAAGDAMPWVFRLIHAFGSPNTVWTTHVCNWHKDFTPTLSVGADNGMPDYAGTGCIIHWGFNPAASWPAQARETTEAIRRGAKLIVVDPRRAGLAKKADLWLRVRPGSDGALMLGMAGELIAREWYDREFIRNWSNGPFLVREDNGRFLRGDALGADAADYVIWDEERQAPACLSPGGGRGEALARQPALFGQYAVAAVDGPVRCRPAFGLYAKLCGQYPPERVEAITGVPAARVRDAARMMHESGPVSYYAWSGLGQGTNATQTSRALSLLHALSGDIDRPGGNVYFSKPPLNNVAGAELMPEAQLGKALGADAHPLGPHARGWITTRELYPAIIEGRPYPVRGLFAFGSSLLSTRPRPDQGEEALKRLEFYAHCDISHNAMSRHADILLPVASPWEREGLMAGFAIGQEADSLLQLRAPLVPPKGEARPETWIVFELAKRLGLGGHFFGGDAEAGLRHLLAPSGVSLERLRERPEGVRLPLETRYGKYRESGFNTPSRRVEFYSQQLLDAGQPPLPEYIEPAVGPLSRPDLAADYPLVLTSAKWVPYCHSQFRDIPRLRRQLPEPLLELHPDAAAARGIREGEAVRIVSETGEMSAMARFNSSLDPGVVCAQYGWWSWREPGQGDANYAGLIGNAGADPVSGSLPLRAYLCEVRRSEG
ncbi:MAG: molybdopterin-dependent oxidoreductase [Gammaproteobacteria bacterium]|nr:molybdopterin-dependent oxidoreductase [Gammaproteobacteria bacterium]